MAVRFEQNSVEEQKYLEWKYDTAGERWALDFLTQIRSLDYFGLLANSFSFIF